MMICGLPQSYSPPIPALEIFYAQHDMQIAFLLLNNGDLRTKTKMGMAD